MTTQALSPAYTTHTQLHTLAPHLADQVAAAVGASSRPNTLRAYQSDLRAYGAWCEGNGLQALPATPDTVAAYLADQATHGGPKGTGLAVTTLRRHLATISKAHQLAGYTHERNPAHSELVTHTLKGLRNEKGAAPDQAPAMTPELLRQVVEAITTTVPASHGRGERPDLAGLRDRALLLVGWCAALRRSELAQLRWGQVRWAPGGARLELLGTKTDKGNTGQPVPVAAEPGSDLCPVAALQAWQEACSGRGYWKRGTWQDGAGDDRPVFPAMNRHGHLGEAMTPHSVGAIITNRSAAAGVEGMTGHSLRRGLIQAAYLAGRTDSEIMQTSRHRSVNMVRTYESDAGLLERAASRGLLA
jgi:integrase